MPLCPAWGMSSFLVVCVVSLLLPWPCEAGRILVFPVDGSHWINMKIMIEELHARGHHIDVIRASSSWYIKADSPHYHTIHIPQEPVFEDIFGEFLDINFKAQQENTSALTLIKLAKDMFSMMSNIHYLTAEMVIQMLEDENLVKFLLDAQYDLVLTDPVIGAGAILAKYLKLPLVLNARWNIGGEGHFDIAPSPLSYIPVPGSGLTDKMSFMQRVKNMLFHGVILLQQRILVERHYNAVCDKYIEGGCDIMTLHQEADIWLFRTDFVFDFPRPTMPNVVYIGGYQCKASQPLPTELEEFVQSAGEHGVVIMTLGTLVKALPSEIADGIASAFAKIPQKVIWRHIGERPSTLGNNTLIVDWMPQRDLLGHPQIKAFVAHGGTNGVQEAIYHGVPVLGIPLFFDQYDNLLHLQEKGAGKIIELADVNGRTFEQGLNEVLHQDSYRENMQRLSRLHRDQPITPMDHAIFWVEFVMRHKGASHLRTEAYRMPWYAYYSVDVFLVLLTAVGLLMITTVTMIRFLCCRGRRKIKNKQQ